MLYYLFQFLDKYDIPGAGMFQYVTFRAAMSAILALFIAIVFGRKIIDRLQKNKLEKQSVISIWKDNTASAERQQWVV